MITKARALLTTLMTLVAFAAASAPAGAHLAYPYPTAQNHLYNLYQSHCGNGLAWVCQSRLLRWSATPVGEHSYAVYYSWTEVYVPTANPRWCSVYARDDTHVGWIVQIYEQETCHG